MDTITAARGRRSPHSQQPYNYDYDQIKISHREDVDAITPCRLEKTFSGSQQQRPGSGGSAKSWRSGQQPPLVGLISVGDDGGGGSGEEYADESEREASEMMDREILWHQMLLVQGRFGCYKSARMQAALEGYDMLIPSKTCLDLINDSIGEMPEDAKQRIEDFLQQEGSGARAKKGKLRRLLRRVMSASHV